MPAIQALIVGRPAVPAIDAGVRARVPTDGDACYPEGGHGGPPH
jgi:hypothetical protein